MCIFGFVTFFLSYGSDIKGVEWLSALLIAFCGDVSAESSTLCVIDMSSDKLTIKGNYLLRIIIYKKKNYHFICKLQKSLYLCSRKQGK